MKKFILTTSLILGSITSLIAQNYIPKAQEDIVSRNEANALTFNVITNDKITINGIDQTVTLTGSNKNAEITKIGTWPTGVTLDSSTGIVSVLSGVYVKEPLAYRLTSIAPSGNNNQYKSAAILINSWDAKTIKEESNSINVCENTLLQFSNNGASIPVDGLGLPEYFYYVSYDHGGTWMLNNQTDNAHTSIKITAAEGELWVVRKAVSKDETLYGYSNIIKINVFKNKITYSSDNFFSVKKGTTVTLPTVTASMSNLANSITITDPNNATVPQNYTKTYDTVGNFIYTVKAVADDNTLVCDGYSSITVQVYDELACSETFTRTYAKNTTKSILGINDNIEKSSDGDIFTYSNMANVISLLGIGSAFQNLIFENQIAAGKPITVKLGQNYSLLQLAGGITMQPIDQNGNTLGPLQSIKEGALLDLLAGPNIFEHEFYAKNISGQHIPCYGVRIVLGSLLGAGATVKVYEAYTTTKITENTSCGTSPTIQVTGITAPDGISPVKLNSTTQDVLYGVEDIGLGVASALSTVVNPYYAVDDNLDTYCSFVKAAGVANKKRLTVILRKPARPGDQIRVIVGGGGIPLLDLDVVNSFKIQRYNGSVKVGAVITGSSLRILDLDLFNIFTSGDKRKVTIGFATDQPFDRIELTDLSVVTVGLLGDIDKRIFDVSVIPSLTFEGQLAPDETTPLCAASFLQVMKVDSCTDYIISLAHQVVDADNFVTGYTEIIDSTLNKIGESTSRAFFSFKKLYPQYDGKLYLKVQPTRNGCNYGEPQYMKISLSNCNGAITNPVIHQK